MVPLVLEGIRPIWIKDPPRGVRRSNPSLEDLVVAKELIKEYVSVGALKRVSGKVPCLVPWFIVYYPKPRLIINCKELNACLLEAPYFRLSSWNQIFPFLEVGMFGAKLDIKHAYFHLPVHPSLKVFLNILVGQDVYQFQGAPFGMHCIPFLWTKLMQVFVKRWRSKGILCFVYLDDILILGKTAELCRKGIDMVLKDLLEANFLINFGKSVLEPTQHLEVLGLTLDLENGFLGVPPTKKKSYRRSIGKVLTRTTMSPRHMATILGRVRSLLPALPAMRCFTDQLVKFVEKAYVVGWDTPIVIPQLLKSQVPDVAYLLEKYPGRPFYRPPSRGATHLASDATTKAWGGL